MWGECYQETEGNGRSLTQRDSSLSVPDKDALGLKTYLEMLCDEASRADSLW